MTDLESFFNENFFQKKRVTTPKNKFEKDQFGGVPESHYEPSFKNHNFENHNFENHNFGSEEVPKSRPKVPTNPLKGLNGQDFWEDNVMSGAKIGSNTDSIKRRQDVIEKGSKDQISESKLLRKTNGKLSNQSYQL